MWLVEKKTYKLTWFANEDVPTYQILSHRWQDGETDMQTYASVDETTDNISPGVSKVYNFCNHAMSYPGDYVWVDTCCIDKRSSAELQEAINSMFNWYENADCCFIHFSDIEISSKFDNAHLEEQQDEIRRHLKATQWFRRGWTLQELLAPKKLVFFDQNWKQFGSSDDLKPLLQDITSIPAKYIGDITAMRSTTIAERMSWMANRKTLRTEDLAYCLLGIFDVNMPMLYGEGPKAFQRLQREIINAGEDETIFAWTSDVKTPDGRVPVLATEPSQFAACHGLDIRVDNYYDRGEYRATSKGLEIETCVPRSDRFTKDLRLYLNVIRDDKRMYIDLVKPDRALKDSIQWHRQQCAELTFIEQRFAHAPPSEYKAFQDQSFANLRRMTGGASQSMYEHKQSLMAMNYGSEVVKYKLSLR